MIRYKQPVCLVGGGVLPEQHIDIARAITPHFIAADGAADTLWQLGVRPNHIIGDMDSIADMTVWAERSVQLHKSADQDSTDFDKSLAMISAPLILAIGFSGGRLDHQISVLSRIAAVDNPVVMLSEQDVCFRCPQTLCLKTTIGQRISLVPFEETSAIMSEGLDWPLQGVTLSPMGLHGTSNRANADQIVIRHPGIPMLIIVPHTELCHVVKAVQEDV